MLEAERSQRTRRHDVMKGPLPSSFVSGILKDLGKPKGQRGLGSKMGKNERSVKTPHAKAWRSPGEASMLALRAATRALLETGVDRFGFEGQDTEDTFVD